MKGATWAATTMTEVSFSTTVTEEAKQPHAALAAPSLSPESGSHHVLLRPRPTPAEVIAKRLAPANLTRTTGFPSCVALQNCTHNAVFYVCQHLPLRHCFCCWQRRQNS
jgi:hypothetical protein